MKGGVNMDEKEKKEETQTSKKEGTDANTKDGLSTQEEKPTMIAEAERAAELMRIENDRKEKLQAKEEELIAKRTLGGTTEAGLPTPEKEKETDEQYANRVARGEANPLKDDGFIK